MNTNDVDLATLSKCLNILEELFDNAEAIMKWLEIPHPLLSLKKPRELLVTGKVDHVIRVLILTRVLRKIGDTHK